MEEVADLRDRVATLEAELEFADGELRKVKEREQKLLDKVLDKSLGDQFYDSELIRSFRNIREEVQRLAKSSLYATSGNSRRPWVTELSDNDPFFEEWYRVPRKERRLLIRSRMFELLQQYILGCSIFGVSASVMATQHEVAQFQDIEASLCDFERVLKGRKGVLNFIFGDAETSNSFRS